MNKDEQAELDYLEYRDRLKAHGIIPECLRQTPDGVMAVYRTEAGERLVPYDEDLRAQQDKLEQMVAGLSPEERAQREQMHAQIIAKFAPDYFAAEWNVEGEQPL